MKCTNCGFPLSPNNTQMICPRCHSTPLSGAKAGMGHSPQPSQLRNNQEWNGLEAQADWQSSAQEQPFFYNQAGVPVQMQSLPANSTMPSSPQWNTAPEHHQRPVPLIAQIPLPQPGQFWHSTPTLTPPPTPTPTALSVPPTPTPGMFETIGNIHNNTSNPSQPPPRTTDNMHASANTLERWRTKHIKSNLGFIVATAFVSTGGLLLILVYILALGLPTHNVTSAFTGTPPATRNILPSPTTLAKAPTALPTPTTSAFPGQQYIDNPQMASAVNINTAQPLQTTTAFRVNQRIYVTFAIHPDGKSGAVCLYWYLNNHAVTQFPFSVTADARAGYSYAIYGGSGNGYVEIYWASTVACSDKMLAQHVNFTVTA